MINYKKYFFLFLLAYSVVLVLFCYKLMEPDELDKNDSKIIDVEIDDFVPDSVICNVSDSIIFSGCGDCDLVRDYYSNAYYDSVIELDANYSVSVSAISKCNRLEYLGLEVNRMMTKKNKIKPIVGVSIVDGSDIQVVAGAQYNNYSVLVGKNLLGKGLDFSIIYTF